MRLLELLDELSRLEPEGVSVDADGQLTDGDVKIPIGEQGFTRGQLWDIVAYIGKRCEERKWEYTVGRREDLDDDHNQIFYWYGYVGVIMPYYTENHMEESLEDFCTPLVEAHVKAVKSYQKVEQED